MKTWREDAQAGLLLLAGVVVIVAITFAGLMFGSWFADLVYRAGAHGAPAAWVAHATGLVLTIIVVGTLVARLFTGEWWIFD